MARSQILESTNSEDSGCPRGIRLATTSTTSAWTWV
jgi:hypothetical protein